jgi:hypothetical protein
MFVIKTATCNELFDFYTACRYLFRAQIEKEFAAVAKFYYRKRAATSGFFRTYFKIMFIVIYRKKIAPLSLN